MEEYDKRVHFLNKRIENKQNQHGPYQDARIILMQNNIEDPLYIRRNSDRNGVKSNVGISNDKDFFLPGMNAKTGLT